MFIEDLNHKTKQEIGELSKVEDTFRLVFREKPNIDKLQLFSDLVIKGKKDRISLVLNIRDDNWIDLKDFKCISESVFKVEFHTFVVKPAFENLDGIEYFQNIKGIAFLYIYSNKIDLEKLTACPKLEYISLENNLTKQQHKALNKLKNIKRLSVKGLDVSLLEEFSDLEKLFVLGIKNADDLDIKMPNLKEISLHRSTKITRLDFLRGLKKVENITLDSLSNVIELPNLQSLEHLKGFSVMNFKRLEKVSKFNCVLEGLRFGENIPLLRVSDLTYITPKDLPNLKDICIKFDKARENKKLLDIFKKQGVEIRY